MTFEITMDSNLVIIDYYTPSLSTKGDKMHGRIAIWAKDIPDLIKSLKVEGF